MYADDLVYVKPVCSSSSLEDAQEDLNILSTCYSDLGLSINPKKSQILLVSASRRSVDCPEVSLKIDGTELQRVHILKYLGVFIDESFSFSTHIRSSAIKAKKELGALHRRLGKWIPPAVFLKVFRQVILPQLTYSLPIAAPHYKRDWRLLEGIQKFALRLISNNYQKSYAELLQEFNMCPVVRIYFDLAARFAYKSVYGLRHSPSNLFCNFAALEKRPYNLRSKAANSINPLLDWKFTRSRPLEICTSMPVYRLIRIWNLLSDAVVSYGFKQFCSRLSDSDVSFDRFCTTFDTFCVF